MTKLSLLPEALAGAPGFRPPTEPGPGPPPAAPRFPAPDTGVIEILGLFDLNPPVFEMLCNQKKQDYIGEWIFYSHQYHQIF